MMKISNAFGSYFVDDLQKAKAFYAGTLGLNVTETPEGLALKYRWAIERLERILGTTIRAVHVVGGGTKNALLCQFTADACGRPVHAGPVEATAAGNVLLQMMGRGRIGSVAGAREIVARSFPVTVFIDDLDGAFAGRWRHRLHRDLLGRHHVRHGGGHARRRRWRDRHPGGWARGRSRCRRDDRLVR